MKIDSIVLLKELLNLKSEIKNEIQYKSDYFDIHLKGQCDGIEQVIELILDWDK